MDDLLNSFADHSITNNLVNDPTNNDITDNLSNNITDQTIQSPTEEGYIYHFVNGSPAGSGHERLICADSDIPASTLTQTQVPLTNGAIKSHTDFEEIDPVTTASAGKDDTFFDIEKESHQSIGDENTDEADYNTDIDENDDDLAVNNDRQNDLDGFAQHLRRLRRQDMERDELLTQLYHENLGLKRALKESVPGGNPRAEAAERSLFETRKSLATNPYVCVLIDGNGYKIHEDLLQSGKRGGAEAAGRLWAEVSNYLYQFGDAKYWEIMVHLYIDVGGLLARCVNNDIPLSDDNVRDFMLGFNQAQPLFTIVDVGHDPERLSQKVEGMFHLFVNNVQCKHLIFGCCHNSAYAVTLEPYISNPITASRITLLTSYGDNTYFESLPFSSVEFPHVFRSTPFKETDRLGEAIDYMQDIPQQSDSGGVTREAEKSSENKVAGGHGALAKWQAASNAAIPLPVRNARPTNPRSTWGSNQTVLLNINDERVDPSPLEEDYDTSERMKDLMEVQRFCTFYHLQGSCVSQLPGPGGPMRQDCKFRHGSRLNPEEMKVLRNYVKNVPCARGPKCRQPDCIFGHSCHDQPGCTKGARCPFYRVHEVDPTVVRVWKPYGNTSPRKR